jgi:hypothetical protein
MATQAPQLGYIEYLDKEMTIMGVLCAFCVSAAAAVLWKINDAKEKTLLWRMVEHTPWLTFIGTFAVFFAALLFYRQRSLLAYFYGQIVLSVSHPKITSLTVDELLTEADSWATWLLYRWAFVVLSLGFVGWSGALVLGRFAIAENSWPLGAYVAVTIAAILSMARTHYVLSKLRYDPSPLTPFWRTFLLRTFPA